MNGNTLQNVLKGLDERERKDFLALVSGFHQGRLAEVCRYLIAAEGYSEMDLMADIPLSKHHKTVYLAQIEDLLLQYLAGQGDEAKLNESYTLVRRLITYLHYDAATDLLPTVFGAAEGIEHFQMILALWESVEMMPEEPKLDVMSAAEAVKRLGNLVAYKDLSIQLAATRKEPDVATRIKAIEAIRDSPLLESPSLALSERARFLFWKVKAIVHVHLWYVSDAIFAQEALTVHLATYPWVCLDKELNAIREMKILSQLLSVNDQFDRCREVSQRIEAFPTSNPLALQEKLSQKYPFDIGIAVSKGNFEEGNEACSSLIKLLDNNKMPYTPTFVTENLCYCAYFYLASAQFVEAVKICARLKSFTRLDFRPTLFAMSRLLEIILAIETDNWDDAIRHIKNTNASQAALAVFPGLKQALVFLNSTLQKSSFSHPRISLNYSETEYSKLRLAIEGQELPKYFDLLAWLEAKKMNRPMLEIFKHRADRMKLDKSHPI